MVDRWLAFCISQFISGTLGFLWGFITQTILWLYVGGFFFSLGTFAITRWGYDRWKARQKPRRLRRK